MQLLSNKVSQGGYQEKNCCRIGDAGGRGVAVIGAIPVERARIKLPPSGDQTELYFLPFLPRFTFVPISVTIRLIPVVFYSFYISIHYALAPAHCCNIISDIWFCDDQNSNSNFNNRDHPVTVGGLTNQAQAIKLVLNFQPLL